MTNWVATNTTGNYCLSKSCACHIIFITTCAQNVFIQREHKQWTSTLFANSMFNYHQPRVSHSLFLHHLSSWPTIWKWIWLMFNNLPIFNDFVVSVIFWVYACAIQYECCKQPNYHFGISQGSVARVLMWGGQNYSHLCQIFFAVLHAEIIKIGCCFTKSIQGIKMAWFFRDPVYNCYYNCCSITTITTITEKVWVVP